MHPAGLGDDAVSSWTIFGNQGLGSIAPMAWFRSSMQPLSHMEKSKLGLAILLSGTSPQNIPIVFLC